MFTQYSHNWRLFIRQAFCAILLGIIAVVYPVTTLGWITLLFGVYAFANGSSLVAGLIEITGVRVCRVPVSAQAFKRSTNRS